MSESRSIDELLAEALQQPEGALRDAWLREACEGDAMLLDEVRELIAAHESAKSFLAEPLVYLKDPDTIHAAPPVELGPFRFECEIGRGGMGIVYRARDTRLDRLVAIKALPHNMARDPKKMARFEQEAKTLATLNHTNIASIHGLEEHEGRKFLVLEYVDGPTLADRLRKGRLAIDEALLICAQIAAAVGAAHDAGVIHRDLKPANIKITEDGTVKVLDFGLAKMIGHTEPAPNGDAGKMTHKSHSLAGAIMGTAAYMSPEQARGRDVDHRSDVWSFGVVFYECLTGVSYFKCESAADSINAVLRKPIILDELPFDATPIIRHILLRCLERDRSQRLRDMHDVRVALEHDSSSTDLSFLRHPPQRLVSRWVLIAALVATLVFGVFLGWVTRKAGESPPSTEAPIHLSVPASLGNLNYIDCAISPDGKTIAYVSSEPGESLETRAIYVQSIYSTESQRLDGTEYAYMIRFSPDSSQILYDWDDPDSSVSELRRVNLDSGAVLTVVADDPDAEYDALNNAGWLSDTELIFPSRDGASLWQTSVSSGLPRHATTIMTLEGDADLFGVRSLSVIPGGRGVLIGRSRSSTKEFVVVAVSLKTGEQTFILNNAMIPFAVPSGYVMFVRDGSVCAAPFDLESMRMTGPFIAMLENVTGRASISNNGTLLYPTQNPTGPRRLMAISRSGERESIGDITGNFMGDLSISPDGLRIALTAVQSRRNYRVQVVDLDNSTLLEIPTGDVSVYGPIWLPDGRLVYQGHNEETNPGLTQLGWPGFGHRLQALVADVDLIPTGEELFRLEVEGAWLLHLSDITPDGRYALVNVLFSEDGPTVAICAMDLLNGGGPKVILSGLVEGPNLSPDGKWLAYESIATSRSEVMVRAFDPKLPADQPSVQVSLAGGRHPSWSSDSSEIFFIDLTDGHVMGVDLQTDAGLSVSRPRKILDYEDMDRYKSVAPGYKKIPVLPDGRFAYVANPAVKSESDLRIVLNYDNELSSKVVPDESAADSP